MQPPLPDIASRPLESLSAPVPLIDESAIGDRRRPPRKRKASLITPMVTEESPSTHEVGFDTSGPSPEQHKKSRLPRTTVSAKPPFRTSEEFGNLGEPPTNQHKHGINGFVPCSPATPTESISAALTRRSGRFKDPPPTPPIPAPQTPKLKVLYFQSILWFSELTCFVL